MYTRSQGGLVTEPASSSSSRGKKTGGVDGGDELVRGETRSKTAFRRTSRGNYDSLAALRRAHQKVFSLEPLFVMCGE